MFLRGLSLRFFNCASYHRIIIDLNWCDKRGGVFSGCVNVIEV